MKLASETVPSPGVRRHRDDREYSTLNQQTVEQTDK